MRLTESDKIGWLAAAATIILGFGPFLCLSLMTGTFWPRSHVSVPLSLSPSILVGDSLLIPLFNRYAVPIVWRSLTEGRFSSPVSARLWLLGFSSFAVSLAVNVILHILWTKDAYTGFIDPLPGHLSLGGKWHCAFASLEMAFVLFFVEICLMFRLDKTRICRDDVVQSWRIFICYASMSIADALVMILVVGRPASELAAPDLMALSPPILAVAVYFLFLRVIPA
jgi:hypothetical protein